MRSIYRLKADELNTDFLEGLKLIFKNQEIEIIVSAVGEELEADTSEVIQASLKQALQDVKAGKTRPISELWTGIDD
ncbi:MULTISPECIES: hypothetical protein [Cyanophyceae]|uniref:hypothetical protein n=1 Tax=Cyanophyceae TaxID=3028117 RepID=UPI000C075699|nr:MULTISPECIES: hypothetical protein [Cyanophyceae]QCS49263.1 hypothetical protein FEK30_07340 [Picosynechococcus sp. PCC 11901]